MAAGTGPAPTKATPAAKKPKPGDEEVTVKIIYSPDKTQMGKTKKMRRRDAVAAQQENRVRILTGDEDAAPTSAS